MSSVSRGPGSRLIVVWLVWIASGKGKRRGPRGDHPSPLPGTTGRDLRAPMFLAGPSGDRGHGRDRPACDAWFVGRCAGSGSGPRTRSARRQPFPQCCAIRHGQAGATVRRERIALANFVEQTRDRVWQCLVGGPVRRGSGVYANARPGLEVRLRAPRHSIHLPGVATDIPRSRASHDGSHRQQLLHRARGVGPDHDSREQAVNQATQYAGYASSRRAHLILARHFGDDDDGDADGEHQPANRGERSEIIHSVNVHPNLTSGYGP